jgi:hypothetical protein
MINPQEQLIPNKNSSNFVSFYEKCEYKGEKTYFSEGNHINTNKKFGSIIIPANFAVILYENSNLTGKKVTLIKDNNCLSNMNIGSFFIFNNNAKKNIALSQTISKPMSQSISQPMSQPMSQPILKPISNKISTSSFPKIINESQPVQSIISKESPASYFNLYLFLVLFIILCLTGGLYFYYKNN